MWFKRKQPIWRHGDVFIQSCKQMPADAQELPHRVLAKGERTGHAHRIQERDGNQLFRHREEMYLRVHTGVATVTHEEHKPISLKPGTYRVWIQREYTPEAIRRVVD